jgi:hypothetical protein
MIAIGQQIINTELAAMQPIAQMGIYGIPASFMIRGMGYASVGIIAAQTIAGMAHDGIDNVPKEGTWLLDKGERVVDSRTNADLKNYLSQKNSGGGITVNVNTLPGTTAKVSRGENGELTIDIVEEYVISSIAKPNSKISQAIDSYTTASRRR